MASFAPQVTSPVMFSGGPTGCDLSIIIVSWNVWPILGGCLRSIEHASRSIPGEPHLRHFGPAGSPGALEVIVVDNASHDATPAELPQAFPWVRLIASTENLGFTRGNNLGYAWSRGRYIYFLNPDTELDQGHTHRLATARGCRRPTTACGCCTQRSPKRRASAWWDPNFATRTANNKGACAAFPHRPPASSKARGWAASGAAIRGHGACT